MNDHRRSPQHDTAPAAEPEQTGAIGHAAGVLRDTATDAAHRTAVAIEGNPVGMLVGGLAIGAIVAALLPRTTAETRILGPVGHQITDRASGAFEVAKERGREELHQAGISRDAAREQGSQLVDSLLRAVTAAGAAAVQHAANRRTD